VVCRVSGLRPRAFLEREVTGPLGTDFTIGPPEREAGRTARLVRAPTAPRGERAPVLGRSAPAVLAALTNPVVGAREGNTPEWRAAEIPAVNGHGTARAVAACTGCWRGGAAPAGGACCPPPRPSVYAKGRAPGTWCSAPGPTGTPRPGSAVAERRERLVRAEPAHLRP